MPQLLPRPALKATLTRPAACPAPQADQGTFGRLVFGAESCYTTELPWLDNLRQRSCIPAGVYTCAPVQSPKFGRVYGVQAVPGRSNVLIHSANFGGNVDAGFDTQLHGCIAPCERVGIMRNSKGMMQAAGIFSRPALNRLLAWAAWQPFTLEII
jgi:Family of unknown function (DUF5675)